MSPPLTFHLLAKCQSQGCPSCLLLFSSVGLVPFAMLNVLHCHLTHNLKEPLGDKDINIRNSDIEENTNKISPLISAN